MSKSAIARLCLLLFAILVGVVGNAGASDWLPVSPDDLKLTSEPQAPGADAIILYRQSDFDDTQSLATHYYRIKILTEKGKDQANVQIFYNKDYFRIGKIQARVIQPDGTIIPFNGKAYDKVVVKANGLRVSAKSITLPDVKVGSIIEYRYDEGWDMDRYYAPRWIVQENLFTREAKFSMKPALSDAGISWVWFGPPTLKPDNKGETIKLDVTNIPAFQEEDYIPPEDELKWRVEFYYRFGGPGAQSSKPDEFWRQYGKDTYKAADDFTKKHGTIEQAVASLPAGDSPEAKLRKLYARAQQIRNLTYERDMSSQEIKRANFKDNNNADDVLKHGYGWQNQIDETFAALAMAAGFDTSILRVPDRDDHFFHMDTPDRAQMDGVVVMVNLNGKPAYFDPGKPFCPFGMVPWEKTSVKALKLTKDGGTFVDMPDGLTADGRLQRKAQFTMDSEGNLKGKMQVMFYGNRSVHRRIDALQSDEASWRSDLEKEIKSWLPATATITIDSVEGLKTSEDPLKVNVSIEIPSLSSHMGTYRLLMPTTILAAGTAGFGTGADRMYPIYFAYPYAEDDEVTLQLPENMKVNSLPEARDFKANYASYSAHRTAAGGTITLTRTMTMDFWMIPAKYYSVIRGFFSMVKTDDDDQMVLQGSAPSGD